jgi:hypothetical protein
VASSLEYIVRNQGRLLVVFIWSRFKLLLEKYKSSLLMSLQRLPARFFSEFLLGIITYGLYTSHKIEIGHKDIEIFASITSVQLCLSVAWHH